MCHQVSFEGNFMAVFQPTASRPSWDLGCLGTWGTVDTSLSASRHQLKTALPLSKKRFSDHPGLHLGHQFMVLQRPPLDSNRSSLESPACFALPSNVWHA